jgi:hypothetical protein
MEVTVKKRKGRSCLLCESTSFIIHPRLSSITKSHLYNSEQHSMSPGTLPSSHHQTIRKSRPPLPPHPHPRKDATTQNRLDKWHIRVPE